MVKMVEIKVHRTDKSVEPPTYARNGDAAFDLRSAEERVLQPGEKHIVKTGLRVAIPEGYVGLIWDRSSMVTKGKTLHCLAGVIDSGYRGEVGVVLKNLDDSEFKIEKNMKVAQMLIQPVMSARLVEVEELDENTDRGAGGFGSTGTK
jgi:dUTP pyrophosphatase